MSVLHFFGKDTRRSVKRAIQEIESQTSAEVMVAVRPISGNYRAADYLAGSLVALVVVLVFVFHPDPFDSNLFPLEVVAAFGVGAVLSATMVPLRRLLTPPSTLHSNVVRAAKEKFYDRGVSKTRDRSGLLVFVSMFEREAVLVPDVGIDRNAHGRELSEAEELLVAAVRRKDVDAFTEALGTLGPTLAAICPRRDDDTNELPDEPEVA
jgi:putative membrane protein